MDWNNVLWIHLPSEGGDDAMTLKISVSVVNENRTSVLNEI